MCSTNTPVSCSCSLLHGSSLLNSLDAGDDWVETALDSFFENSRMGDDELWGTALVDGDGRHLVEFVGATVLKQLSNRLLCHELLFFFMALCLSHCCRTAWLLAATGTARSSSSKSLAACGMSIKNLKQSSKMQMRNNSSGETWRAFELKQC